MGTGMEMRR